MLTDNVSEAVINMQAAALLAMLDNGYMDLYDGDQPKTAQESPSSHRLLVSLRFASPAAPAPAGGLLRFAPLAAGVVEQPGIATWYRCFAQDHKTVIMDGSVGVPKDGEVFNLELNNVNLLVTARVSVNNFTHKVEG